MEHPLEALEALEPLGTPAPIKPAGDPTVTLTRSVQSWWGRAVGAARTVALVFVAFMALGNLAIFAMSLWARADATRAVEVEGIGNFREVDDRLWRGAAPSPAGYRALAVAGASTVVDLRAEEGVHVDRARLTALGLGYVNLPMRDGQAPTEGQVDRFLRVVDNAPGPVFVHCGAGVGRSGTMAAAYLSATGEAGAWEALKLNLAVGPPSLEQIAFAVTLEHRKLGRPNAAVVAASRVLDAPRRLWSRYGL